MGLWGDEEIPWNATSKNHTQKDIRKTSSASSSLLLTEVIFHQISIFYNLTQQSS